MFYQENIKVARMVQPEKLKTAEFNIWSGGRGVDVWAMLCACVAGDLQTVEQLIAADPPLSTCEYGWPLRLAARENHQEIVHFLLAHGADPFQYGHKLVGITRERGHGELAAFFEALLKDKYHISPAATAVADAIKAYDIAKVQQLLEIQPELLEALDERGNAPIHWAVLTRQPALIDYLLKMGANINAKRPDGARPLDLTNGDYHYRSWYRDMPSTAIQKHEVLIGYLIARGAYYDISVAAKMGDFKRVQELLNDDPGLVNIVPHYDGYYSGLPLRNAAAAGHTQVVRLLLERGANPNQPEPGIAPQGGALHAAIGSKHFDIVKLLLEHGANPNADVDSSGNCYWIGKYAGASNELLRLVASYGGAKNFDLIFHDDDVETLAAILRVVPDVHLTEFPQKKGCMELLLRFQPAIISKIRLPRKDPQYTSWLIERGANPNLGDWLGIKPLHEYAKDGNIELAAICLAAGADINALDTDYCSTPLGWAARKGQAAMVQWLLEKGADPALPLDEPWAVPAAWAKRRRHEEVSEILRKHVSARN